MASGSRLRTFNWNATRERSQRLKNAAPSGKTDRELIDDYLATKGATVCHPGTAQNVTKRRGVREP